MSENKLEQERQECGCNRVNCNYVFQPVDVVEIKDGVSQIDRAIMFCQFCTHTEELVLNPHAVQTPGT